MFLQTGYGLEGVLPDALCKRIIDEQIAPRFKTGDFDGGLTAGVQSIIAATKGEYKGTGRTVDDHKNRSGNSFSTVFTIVFIVIFVLFGGRGFFFPWLILSSMGSGNNRGGWGGGGGGGGGFSGGGGSSGGGGAGGSW